jgi:hypothetical protein
MQLQTLEPGAPAGAHAAALATMHRPARTRGQYRRWSPAPARLIRNSRSINKFKTQVQHTRFRARLVFCAGLFPPLCPTLSTEASVPGVLLLPVPQDCENDASGWLAAWSQEVCRLGFAITL